MKTKEELASEYSKSQHKYMLDKRARQVTYAMDQAINISESDFKAGYNACLENITPDQLLPIVEKYFGPGCAAICKERKRQIEAEGWVPEHDDSHVCGELTDAAICYIMRGYWRRRGWIQMFWPWLCDWWKPTPDDRQRELKKGGALTAAEIDRLKSKEENK